MCPVCVFVGASLGLSMYVFGTETHMTAIVGMALGKRELPKEVGFDSNAAANMFFTAQNKVRFWQQQHYMGFQALVLYCGDCSIGWNHLLTSNTSVVQGLVTVYL